MSIKWVEIMKNRLFRFWYYTVSHAQALLRSVGKDDEENIDIYFGGVSYLEIPEEIDGLEIKEPSASDKEYIAGKTGNFRPQDKITVLVHGGQKYYIVSSAVKIMKNKLESYELPFDIPSDMGGIFYRLEDKN